MTKDKNKQKTRQKSVLNDKKRRAKEKRRVLFDKIRIFLANTLYPDDCNCIVCDKEIPRGNKYCMCEDCFKTFPFNNGKICVRCGAPIDNEANYCLECQNNTKSFDFARSSLVYEKVAQRLILNMKFHNQRWLAKYFAEMLFDTYVGNKLDAEVIVAVPISNEREKERGYNQSLLVARYLSNKLGLPLVTDAVIKIKDNKRQAKLNSRERHENVLGAYKTQNKEGVKGKKVLLLDDILTTGSTMSEVARKLKIAGASAVYGLAIASPHYKVPSEKNEEDFNDFEIV